MHRATRRVQNCQGGVPARERGNRGDLLPARKLLLIDPTSLLNESAIAICSAKARRAGAPLRPQPESGADQRSRRAVERAYETGQEKRKHGSASPRRAPRQERL